MPTLDVAARQLGISEKTLRKWMRRLEIVATRHPRDWRYQVIADEDVQTIKTARAEMPGASPVRLSPVIPSYSSLAFDRRSTADDDARPSSLPIESLAPTPRPRPPRAAALKARGEKNDLPPMPAGHVGRQELAQTHGIPPATLIAWCNAGRIETLPGEYSSGMPGAFPIRNPVTPHGLAQFYQLASPRSDFVRCDDCPHSDELEASTE